jgi:hypothetical protein
LLLGISIDGNFLPLSERNQSIIWAVESVIPLIVSGESVLKVRVDVELVLIEDFHGLAVIELLLERLVEEGSALSGGEIATRVHLSGRFESLKREWIVLHFRLHAHILLLVVIQTRSIDVLSQIVLESRLLLANHTELSDAVQMRGVPQFDSILRHIGAIELNKVFVHVFRVLHGVCGTMAVN